MAKKQTIRQAIRQDPAYLSLHFGFLGKEYGDVR